MAEKKFNSVTGFSVGQPGNIIDVVDNFANVYANRVFVEQYANLGDIGNIYIGGGTSGQVLKTDGTGNLTWALDTAPAGGNTTEVQFNNGGSLDGSSAFSFNKISNALSITGNITSENANLGNLVTANYVSGTLVTSSQPNITSVGTLTSVNVSGNVTSSYFIGNGSTLTSITGSNVSGQVGNALVAGTVYTNAQPNITSVGTLVSANISGNVVIGGNLSVDGNIVYTNVETLAIEDPVIEQGNGANNNPLTSNDNKDRGSLLHYYTTKPVDAFMGWDNSSAEFAFGSNVSMSGDIATFNEYGNIRARYFLGNGSQLTGIIGNANYAAYAGNVINTSQPNISSVGTLTSLTVSGLVTATTGGIKVGNLQDTSGTNTIQLTNSDIIVTGNIIAGGGGTGNVTATYFIGNGSQLTGVVGSANYAAYAGNVTNASQPNITSVGTLSNLSVTGTFTKDNKNVPTYTSSTSTPTNPTVGDQWYDQTNDITYQYIYDGASYYWVDISSGYIDSNVNAVASTLVLRDANANIYGNYLVGSGLEVTGTSNLGSISNVKITGGSSGYVIQTDGTGNLSFVNAGSTGIAGSNTQVQFNDGGSFGASSGFTFDKTSNSLSVSGNTTSTYFIGNGSALTSITGGNVSGQVGNALVAGTVYTSAQPNITSVGTLTSLTVSGDASISGNLTVQGNTNYVNVDSFTVEDPIIEQGGGPNNAPLTTNDGKDRGSLLHYYTTSPVNAFMGWDNSNGEFAFGSNVSVLNEVVTFNSLGNVRANYFLGNASSLSGINASNISSGTIGSSILGNSTVYIGTTGIALNRTSGSQTLTGISIDGSASSATTAGTVTTNAQPNITSVGTLASLSVTANVSAGNVLTNNLLYANGVAWNLNGTYSNSNVAAYLPTFNGNVSANYFIGNGSTLTNITGSNVIGQVGNALVAGTVYSNAQPNITSVGTLTSLDVSGNANVNGILYANTIVGPSSANVTITAGAFVSEFDDTGNITLSDNVSVVNNLSAANVLTDHLLYANGVAWDLGGTYANSNVANYLPTYTGEITAGNITTTGNITASYLIGNGSQLTGLPAGYANSNVAAYLPTYTGNVAANYFIGNGATLTFVTGANVNGQVANSLVAGTVYTNAQPNITSVGTLTSLSVTSNVSAGNIKSDNLLYANGAPYVFTTSAAGSNTQIQFNDNTAFAGNANLTFNKTTNTVTTDNIDLNGNLTVNGLTDLGSVANITITGGASGYVLTTDGSGGLTWGAAGSGAAGLVSISKDRFLTDGSGNTYSLSTTPASKNLIEVVIDGLQQISNTYSLTGSTLSFPTNPAAGQVIEVTTFGAVDLTGNIGEVQYNAGGAFGSSNTFTFNSGTNTLSVSHLVASGNLTSQAGYVYVNNGIIAVDSGNAGIFNTGVANINLGLAANVTIGSTAGNTTIRGNLLANNASITNLSVGDYYSSRDSVTVTTDSIVDQFPVNTYRSAKYTMRVNSDDGYQAVEVLLVHNGSSSYVTIYGSISSSGSDIITLSSNIGSGNVRLFASTASTNTTVKILGTYVPD